MQITIDLPLPEDGDIEEKLTKEFGHLVSVCKSVLAGYKKNYGVAVPTLSIKLPKSQSKPTQKSECTEFINELLARHIIRVPTANVPAQRKVLKIMFESGHTDKTELLKLYDESLRTYPDTSWFTVKFKLNNPEPKSAAVTSGKDMEFQRVQLSDDAAENLAKRVASYAEKA